MTTHAVPRRDNFASEKRVSWHGYQERYAPTALSRLAHRPLPLTSVGAFFDTSAIHRKDEILFAAARTVMLNGIEHFSIVTDQRRVRPASGPVAGAPIGFGLFIFLRFHRRLP